MKVKCITTPPVDVDGVEFKRPGMVGDVPASPAVSEAIKAGLVEIVNEPTPKPVQTTAAPSVAPNLTKSTGSSKRPAKKGR